ncbi:Chaperone protein HscA [Pseudoclavibacter triregionum]|nr:Chaperone protein HscA [Pseudoclavibacter triregionum]
MRLGIDFGTTRTVVAAADRGNLPVLGFDDEHGDVHDHLPTAVALGEDGRLLGGWGAEAAALAGRPVARSFKRLLAEGGATGAEPVAFGAASRPLREVLEAFAREVVRAVREDSTLAEDAAGAELLAVVGVPAHAHSAQRLLTLDAFRAAGVEVLALVNEPSAAAFEYTHRHARSLSSRRTGVVVYDLGGGTFDASLVRVDGVDHEILLTTGLNRLGGDDFDVELAMLAAARAGTSLDALEAGDRARLLLDARIAKEGLVPQSRRMLLDVGEASIAVPVGDFFDAAAPLVETTIDALGPLLGGLDAAALAESEIAGIYLVGGASGLPLVPRRLRERFGRRVHRSPHPGASTAIGLAIAADPGSGFTLRDRLGRGIGVFRERDAGRSVAFDPLVDAGALLGADGELEVTRRYRAAHTLGAFRFVEFTRLDADGEPRGDLLPLAELLVPFDAALADGRDLADAPVDRRGDGPLVEERIRIDVNGVASIRIAVPELGVEIERDAALAGS